MDLTDQNILLTGACGGIGSALAGGLAAADANLMLASRNRRTLEELVRHLPGDPTRYRIVDLNLNHYADCAELIQATESELGSIDILVNLAGIQDFELFEGAEPERIEQITRINLLVPMWLARSALPGMLRRGNGTIINIGSTFGSIGFAHFAAYSATKFGLRGFSEALRRELSETPLRVQYIAPRATRTDINRQAVYEMGRRTGMKIDSPEKVAREIIRAIRSRKSERYIGFPENFFVRINALLPRLVDKALRRQNRAAREFAKQPN